MPKVFISYSHDSREHSERVLELANSLREHGVDAELDQYHVHPEHGWPRWCAEQLREENAEFVLLVCTETYRQRVENKVAADEGRGVYWEGAIIYDYLYEAKGNRRFIPILLDGSHSDCIPRPIRNHTHYCIAAFSLDDDERYHGLYRELTGQPAVVKPPLGKLPRWPAPLILSPLPEKFPASGPNFLGREAELKHAEVPDSGKSRLVILVHGIRTRAVGRDESGICWRPMGAQSSSP
jgi:SEFIR domain-containing protein